MKNISKTKIDKNENFSKSENENIFRNLKNLESNFFDNYFFKSCDTLLIFRLSNKNLRETQGGRGK